jgi:hypothetical protein
MGGLTDRCADRAKTALGHATGGQERIPLSVLRLIGSERPTGGAANQYRRPACGRCGAGHLPKPGTARPPSLMARCGVADRDRGRCGAGHAAAAVMPQVPLNSQKWNERQFPSDLTKLLGWYFFGRSLYPPPHEKRTP